MGSQGSGLSTDDMCTPRVDLFEHAGLLGEWIADAKDPWQHTLRKKAL